MHSSRMRTVRNSSRPGGCVPGPGVCAWSGGGVPGPGGVPAQVLPPVDRHTRVKT